MTATSLLWYLMTFLGLEPIEHAPADRAEAAEARAHDTASRERDAEGQTWQEKLDEMRRISNGF